MAFYIVIVLFMATNSYGQVAGTWTLGNPYLSRIDAVYPFNENYIALISNRNILYMPIVESPEIAPMTALIPGNLFPAEYNSKPISGAISYDKTTVLLFKGNAYLPVDKATLMATGAVGGWNGWPAFWNNDIDAALEWPDGNYVFIKGLQYVSYDPRGGKTSGTAQLNSWPGWPTSWSGSIDGAFNGGDGFIYFIRKGHILAMNADSKRFLPGYPKSLSGSNPGAITAMTGTGQHDQGSVAEANNPALNNTAVTGGDWCAVGTPDQQKTGANGSITASISALAGGTGGKDFKDMLPAGTRVSEIRVWGNWNISAIEIVTESKEGFTTEAGKHGSSLGSPKVFKLVPGECITGIEGTWGGASGEYIYTLRFITNKRKSPEYGGVGGVKGKNQFNAIVPPEASFAGFVGRSSDELKALGIQYYIIQYLFVDSNGKIIENTGDKGAWSSGQTDPTKTAEVRSDGKTDPYIDNFPDIADLSDEQKRNLLGEMWNYTIMPNIEWMGHAVDLTKIDPFDVTATTDLPKYSPLYITPGPIVGGPQNKWFLVNGTNRQRSTSITTGDRNESLHTLNSYNSYAEEFAIQVGGNVGVPFTVAGSLNYGHTQRQTQTIGRERIMFTQTVNRKSHALSFDLNWQDPRTGKKFRQMLHADFRKDVESLTAPLGNIQSIPTEKMGKGTALPDNLTRCRKQYQALIDKWGTHYINDVVFGGYYTMWMMMTSEEIQRSSMTLDSIGAKFDAVIRGVSVGGHAAAQYQRSSASGSSTSSSEVRVTATGGGGNTEFQQWSEAVTQEPRPKAYTFYGIDTLLSSVFFPFDDDIEKKQKTLDIMIRQYLVDNDKPPTHNRNATVKIQTLGEKTAADAAQPVNVRVEFLRMKADQRDGKGEEGEDKQQLFGQLNFSIQGKNERQLKAGSFWETPPNKIFKFDVGGWSEMSNQVYTVRVNKSELADVNLVLYGNVSDDDTWSGDDEYFNLRNVADGVATNFEGLQEPGKTVTIPVNLSGGGGSVVVQVRLTWVN